MTLNTVEPVENEVPSPQSQRSRRFYPVRTRGENPLDSNLTELSAATAADRGAGWSHTDWSGHIARYGHVLKKLVTPKSATWSLLDVGCGQLQLPFYLWRNRCPELKEYWGLELRAKAEWLNDVGWRTSMNLVRMDICIDELPAEAPTQYDMVVCMETYEHVPRAQAPGLMQRLFDWTRPGGVCVFSTPNAGTARSTAENHHGSDGECREWAYQDKLDEQQRVGFTLEASYGVFGGVTRLPKEIWDSPVARAIKEFHHNATAATVLFAAYPELANNSCQILRRPA